jgi:hypothetical protein
MRELSASSHPSRDGGVRSVSVGNIFEGAGRQPTPRRITQLREGAILVSRPSSGTATCCARRPVQASRCGRAGRHGVHGRQGRATRSFARARRSLIGCVYRFLPASDAAIASTLALLVGWLQMEL